MAYIRASQGGGGQVTPDLLWSNSNPSANYGEGAISLNHDISNYDYIKVTCYQDTRLFKVFEFMITVPSDLSATPIPMLVACMLADATYYRIFNLMYGTSTQAYINNCYILGGSATPSALIPWKIEGYKNN